MSVSIITTSYNQRKTLELLFESLKRQTETQFEVIVADDGSSDDTALFAARSWPFPVKIVTQADEGYRKSKILNQAVRAASSDYLIFLDADVILEKHFIEDHLKLRRPDAFVCGRRVDLGPEVSEVLTLQDVSRGGFDRLSLKLFQSFLAKDTRGFKRSLRIIFPTMRQLLGYSRPIDILGSNMSIWKKDLLEINGFNEALESYWGEDGDLYIRLRNSGKKSINAKNICIQYHIFHKRREPTPENVEMIAKLLKNREYRWAARGYVDRQ